MDVAMYGAQLPCRSSINKNLKINIKNCSLPFVSVVVRIDGQPLRLQLCDTAGQVSQEFVIKNQNKTLRNLISTGREV